MWVHPLKLYLAYFCASYLVILGTSLLLAAGVAALKQSSRAKSKNARKLLLIWSSVSLLTGSIGSAETVLHLKIPKKFLPQDTVIYKDEKSPFTGVLVHEQNYRDLASAQESLDAVMNSCLEELPQSQSSNELTWFLGGILAGFITTRILEK